MKVVSVSGLNYHQKTNCKNVSKNQHSTPAFKGVKGAGIGALSGLAYLGIMSIVAAPFLPLTAPLVIAAAGSGAIAGNGLENEFKDKKDD